MNPIERLLTFNWWRWLSILFLGFGIRLTVDLILGLIYKNYEIEWSAIEYLKAIGLAYLLLEGTRWINRRLDEKIPWEGNAFLRFGSQLVSNVIFVAIILLSLRLIFFYLFNESAFIRWSDELILLLVAIAIIFIILVIEVGQFFLKRWRVSLLELERFKKENIEFQFEMLKAQVNPHFLFNSLNTLSSLIFSSQEKASFFLRELAQVYRNVIKNREKEVISLQQELSTTEAYLKLMELRFENGLQINIEVDDDDEDRYFIPPMILQMLIENAIKHNVASQKRPLIIDIYIENDEFLVVRNVLQKKSSTGYSSKIGLSNIIRRYAYLIDKEVIIERDEKYFTVKVPLLLKGL